MRIAFLAETFGCPGYLGGISRYTMLLGQGLVELGHEVHVYTQASLQEACNAMGNELPFTLHHVQRYRPKLFGYRSIYYKFFRQFFPGYCFVNELGISLALNVYRDAKNNLFDLIEAPETGGFLALGTRLISRQVPVIGRLHAPSHITASDHYGPTSRHLRQVMHMETLFLRHALALSAPSQSVADLTQKILGKSGLMEVIPNPVVCPEIPISDVRKIDRPHVVFVGRLEKLKGFDTLMKALPWVYEKIPDAIYDIAGPDPAQIFLNGIESGLRAYMSAENAFRIAPFVRYHGQVSLAKADAIRSGASCVVVPSTYENFPYTLTEAMALARPVVASRTGGMVEIVNDGQNGLLVETGSSAALAEAVIEILANTDKSYALGRQAKIDIKEKFSTPVIAARMADYYSHIRSSWKNDISNISGIQ